MAFSAAMDITTILLAGVVAIFGVLLVVLPPAWQEAAQGNAVLELLDTSYYVSPALRGEGGGDADAKGEEAAPYLSVVIPAYNEEERLPIMLKEALEVLKDSSRRGKTYEILVVDDCSSDSTPAMVLKDYASENIKVVRLLKNQGKGFAVKVGMLSARGKLRLMVDADGATRFSDLEKLERAIAEGDGAGSAGRPTSSSGVDVAFGSRHHMVKGASAKRAWYRNIFTWGLHLLVRLLITGNSNIIHDTQCGFKLFTEEAAMKLFPTLYIRRWAFDLELVVLARMQELSIAEIAVTWQEIPGSKLGLLSATLQMFRDMLRIRLSYMFGVWRIRSFPLPGEGKQD